MPLRATLAGAYLLAVLLIGGGAYLAVSALVSRGFGRVEHEEVVAQLQRAQATLELRADALYSTVGDWASWNETYNYVRSLSPYYVQQNLYRQSLANLGVTFVLILDGTGKQVAYLGFDLRTGRPDARWQAAPSHIPGRLAAPAAGRGLLRLGDAVALVAYRPILHNDGSGPARGTLVMGRVLDAGVTSDLSTVLQAGVRLTPAGGPTPPPTTVRPAGRGSLVGTSVLNGLDGTPAVRLQITQDRPVAEQARATKRALLAALACVALAGGLAAALVVEVQVSRPLTALTRDVAALAEEADPSERVSVPRGRELGRLAAGVNSLLGRLQRRRAELRTRERRFRHLFLDSPIGSAILTTGGRVLQANPAFEQIFGYSAGELSQPGGVLALVQGDRSGEEEREAMASLAQGRVQRYQWERRLVRRDGTPVYALMQMSTLEHDPGAEDAFIVQVLDFTARREREEEALTLAFQDPLTGLANRRVLQHRLADAATAERAEEGALLYLDLDRFKAVNDRHGHDTGDRVLVELTRRMGAELRRSDLLARLGGDEFAAFLPGATASQARAVAERIAATVTEPVETGHGRPAQLAVSVGIALGPTPDETPAHWLRRADEAMYRAKRSGGDRAVIAQAHGAEPRDA